MTSASRAFRETHDPGHRLAPLLPEFEAWRQKHAGAMATSAADLAKTVHLPVAMVRGAVSSYTEIDDGPEVSRVCAGTSCHLAGAGRLARELPHSCKPVYCLGYCDRSPAAMTASGRVIAPLTSGNSHLLGHDHAGQPGTRPEPPKVWSVARHAIVTARLSWPGTASGTMASGACPPYLGLEAARRLLPAQVVQDVIDSGVKGRGGAAYPTGNKWRLAALADADVKFVVANGDEGDPGSFVDRELMERDPHAILEGMAICGHAVGASRGIVFIRAEYPAAAEAMHAAIESARARGYLGPGGDDLFDVEVVRGMGSYVCGEETALLAAIEGRRGEVSPRPPFPTQCGLFGKPTVVDNVETLANIPWIMTHGAGAYASMGSADSKGTKALCLNRGFARPGIVEVEFGIPLREVIEELAGGGAGGVELEAVLLGGPMGSIVTPDQWDVPVCFAAMSRAGINLGHGGLVAIPKPADWGSLLRHLLNFMKEESCGKCVPCRLGSMRVHELARAGLSAATLPEFRGVLDLMREASLCAFGRETPGPIKTILDKFGDRLNGEGRA